LNITGLIDVDTMRAMLCYDDAIAAESTIALFQPIGASCPMAATDAQAAQVRSRPTENFAIIRE
jgi:hypothetical protein